MAQTWTIIHCSGSYQKVNTINLDKLIWGSQHLPLIYNLSSSELSKLENFNILLILSLLMERASSERGIHLVHWSARSLVITTIYVASTTFRELKSWLFCASSIHGIIHDRRSISVPFSTTRSFHQLTYSTIWKSFFIRACSTLRMFQCRGSYLVSISALQSCTF